MAQAQLLRVIEERKVRPVGANKWLDFNARLVLATHRNLEQACAEGRFRHDLYQRICGFTLELPPLRERRADLPCWPITLSGNTATNAPSTSASPAASSMGCSITSGPVMCASYAW